MMASGINCEEVLNKENTDFMICTRNLITCFTNFRNLLLPTCLLI